MKIVQKMLTIHSYSYQVFEILEKLIEYIEESNMNRWTPNQIIKGIREFIKELVSVELIDIEKLDEILPELRKCLKESFELDFYNELEYYFERKIKLKSFRHE